jgi:hypothetical protein
MTREENRQRIKNEALNQIRRVYGKNFQGYDRYDEGSLAEQREFIIRHIIDTLEDDLKNI